MTKRELLRLGLGLFLGLALSAELLTGGLGAMSHWWRMAFPYALVLLMAEALTASWALNDSQLFLLGSGFSFLYEGVYAKSMHDGYSYFGLEWASVLGGPLEWGLLLVLWFHTLDALAPRPEETKRKPHWGTLFAASCIAGAAVLVYALKAAFGYYQADRLLGAFWWLLDLAFVGAAWFFWKRLRLSVERARASEGYRHRPGTWVWVLAVLGLWLLGTGLLAQITSGFDLGQPLFYSGQLIWVGALAAAAWGSWKYRLVMDEEPVRRSRLVLAAAGIRIVGSLLILWLMGPAHEDARAAFLAEFFCDLPSKALFYYAFLTRRLVV